MISTQTTEQMPHSIHQKVRKSHRMIVSHSLVYVDDSATGGTAMLHILTRIKAEGDTAAKKTPVGRNK